MSKYGLNLRVQPSKQAKRTGKLPLPQIPGFMDDDDGDVNQKIVRQATTKKVLKDVEEQHKKALEEDPLVFDYDGFLLSCLLLQIGWVFFQSKYIDALKQKAKEREREHEVIFEKKIVKERSKEDHLFKDKDKFVTGAYKRKLAEQAKWLEGECIRELREEKDDVTKKSDMTDFYFNLTKNVALGAKTAEFSKPVKQDEEAATNTLEKEVGQISPPERGPTRMEREMDQPLQDQKKQEHEAGEKSLEKDQTEQQPLDDQKTREHHKRSEDAVAPAKERFLARKRAKVQILRKLIPAAGNFHMKGFEWSKTLVEAG
ncbi:hypothetical protein GIB67_038708 [Kingdonia uniflora]|uniref:Nuclear speckle splicing regulatory protein 1 N-terminal domain-containing protein n=1 Tax=Kingdonia uniflora TaxID=39325 RepID=A0A7J7NSJ0_9MAGN|nr:hypothetical protein GIB67_038708 [Kingdonia uniflora]